MENTEEKTLFKKYRWILYLGIIALILAFIPKNCNSSEITRQTIITKEQTGTFKNEKPVNEVIKPLRQNDDKFKMVYVQDPEQNSLINKLLAENKKLTEKYKNAPDSIKQALFEDANQLHQFSKTFEDNAVKIDISGVSRGTVESIKADWTVKPQSQEVEVKQKQRIFALKTGAEYGNTKELNNSVFKANLEFENKKGNSYNISFDTDNRFWIGAKFTLFDVKK